MQAPPPHSPRRHLPVLLLLLLGLAARSGAASLRDDPSALVRAQTSSAIHWQPWTEATLTGARASGRSVYVFVGSPLSELTRATINQTFASGKTVAWLNENFFCIFVDADTQPDVAAYAQHFIASVKQLHGSPVHLWLTSDLQPYDGANYLPPSEEWGQPGFLKAARGALETWTGDPAHARALAAEAMAMMRPLPLGAGKTIDLKARLDRGAAAWIAAVDPKHGGFGTAPKQPEPELIRFLVARDPAARAVALNAARALVAGALRDPVDGGFYRRTIDEEWKEPYRQKTLSDQARIVLALLDAAEAANDAKLRAAAFAALDFVLKELRTPDGAFAAALDGTFEADADPAQRPAFVRVGHATATAQGLLIAALLRTGEPRFTTIATQLADRLREQLAASDYTLIRSPGGTTSATAADYTAVALAFRLLKENSVADRLLAHANALFFDATTGTYMASPVKLPPGIAARAPASGDPPSPEALALMAGVDEKTAGPQRRALLSAIEYDEQPPGDVLLALSQALSLAR